MAEDVLQPERNLFWGPRRIMATGLATIAGVAALIANIGTITDSFQPSLSGAWVMTLSIKKSSFKTYEGMTATYQVYLVQDAHRLTGTGEKIKVNGQDIPLGQHQQISLKGSVSGGLAALTYIETAGADHAARQTTGDLNLNVLRAGKISRQASRLEGSFSSTAASTSGTVVAAPQSQ